MTLGTPATNRLKRPSWRDPRLLVGILLVLASVAAVVSLLAGADRTTEVFIAKRDIPVGQKITEDLLDRGRVRLDPVQERYQLAAEGLPSNGFAVQRIPQGELLPKSSIDEAASVDRSPIAFSLDENLPAGAKVGSRVDVWASRPDVRSGGFNEPVRLLAGAEISQLENRSGGLGSNRSTSVYVLVGKQQMPQILDSLANNAKISVVWNPSGGQG
ncbi:flagellar protein FlgA [Arthrobacter russicus]|jgi:hypothetical protein